MEYFVYSLKFIYDKNIDKREYFYRSDIRFLEGDEVVAQIGPNGKFQVGKVTGAFSVTAEGKLKREPVSYNLFKVESSLKKGEIQPPYPVQSLKEIVCKYSFRKVKISPAVNARDLGGIFYDEKHVTAYGSLIRSESKCEKFSSFTPDEVLIFGDGEVDIFVKKVHRFKCFLREGDKAFENGFNREADKLNVFGKIEEKKSESKGTLAAFDVYGEEDGTALKNAPEKRRITKKEFLSAFENYALMGDIFKRVANARGTLLICDKYGSGEVDTVVAILYLLAGVTVGDIAKDYALSVLCLNGKNKRSVETPFSFTPDFSQREYISVLKKFLKKYGSAREYLKEISLTDEEIELLLAKMQRLFTR